jgi:exodeoxyribonuclease V alpha subunit
MRLVNILKDNNIIDTIDYGFALFVNDIHNNENVALCACLLSYYDRKGNSCINLAKISNTTIFAKDDFYGISLPQFPLWVNDLKNHPFVSIQKYPSIMVLDGSFIYLGKRYYEETQLATNIKTRLKTNIAKIDHADKKVKKILKHNFSIINGGPGSGKTTLVLRIISALFDKEKNISLAIVAPTGKAADRLSQSIRANINFYNNIPKKLHEKPQSIHRLLGYSHNTFHFNNKNKLPQDCIIVDEASMISLPLMFALLSAIKKKSRVILIGDYNQLEAVETGDVFSSCCGVGATNNPQIKKQITFLQDSHRFKKSGGIYQSLELIKQKKAKKALKDYILNDKFTDINFIECKEKDNIKTGIEHFFLRYRKPANLQDALGNINKFAVLCVLNKDVREFNFKCNEKLNEEKDDYNGKKLMITENDKKLKIYNGDCGILWQGKNSDFLLHFTGDKKINQNDIKKSETAYAMSIHKSQGSEYDKVVIIMPARETTLLTQQLVYTAISRAKCEVTIIGQSDIFLRACNKKAKRISNLSHRLGYRYEN